MEAAHKSRLAEGEVGIVENKASPAFAILCERFLAWAATNKRPATVKFYNDMVRSLLRYERLNRLPIDQIDETAVDQFIRRRRSSTCRVVIRKANGESQERDTGKLISVVTINRELATLRRMLNLAFRWRVLKTAPQISASSRGGAGACGLIRRGRGLSDVGAAAASGFCHCLPDTALRPGDIQRMRWENLHVNPVSEAEFATFTTQEAARRSEAEPVNDPQST
jgi:integrase